MCLYHAHVPDRDSNQGVRMRLAGTATSPHRAHLAVGRRPKQRGYLGGDLERPCDGRSQACRADGRSSRCLTGLEPGLLRLSNLTAPRFLRNKQLVCGAGVRHTGPAAREVLGRNR